MSPQFVHILGYAGRVVALILGCVAFYFAFFLYEGEEGALQNRLDEVWVEIDERAKQTDTATTAFLNRIFALVSHLLSHIFGGRLISLHMLSMSVNLSLFGFAALYWCDVYSSPLRTLCAAEVALCLASAWVAARYKTAIGYSCTLVPLFVFAKYLSNASGGISTGITDDLVAIGVYLTWSVGSDILALMLLRQVASKIANSPKLSQIIWSIFRLVFGLSAIASIPAYFYYASFSVRGGGNGMGFVQAILEQSAEEFAALNAITAVYLSIPFAILLGLLIHKLMWPLLARALYPLSRYRVLLDKKAMSGAGALGLTIAFNIEAAGWKEVLKLFSK